MSYKKIFLCLFFLGTLLIQKIASAATELQSEEEFYEVYDIDLEGAEFTDREWLISYLELKFPIRLTSKQIKAFSKKLLTTGVFTNVTVTLRQVEASGKMHLLVDLDEKWTLVPVIRAAFGGGTPLTVLGAYDTHSFGRLWTLGSEFRKYGDAKPGFVLWARAPRWKTGKHLLSFELWQDYRIRTFYDSNNQKIGFFKHEQKRLRFNFLTPLSNFFSSNQWQIGMDTQFSQEAPYRFQVSSDSDYTGEDPIPKVERKNNSGLILGKLVHDNMTVDNLDHDGNRSIFNIGSNISEQEQSLRFEIEEFYYYLFGANNFASHFFLGQSGSEKLAGQYFLGGLDSIRGLPDGALWGNHAAYFNLEIRRIMTKAKYLWTQPIMFLDAGIAGNSWNQSIENQRGSAGIGIRLAIPQIYRMVFRIDFAWSIDGSNTKGFTLGMNDLFQPYPPL